MAGEDTLGGGAAEPLTADSLASAFDKLADRLASVVKPTEPAAPPKQPDPPKTYTRAELKALVDDGKITEAEADAQIERQIEARVTERVTSKVEGQQLTQTVQSQIDGYFAKHAELNDRASPTYKRVEAAFADLVRNGSPRTVATELAALKIAIPNADLGPGERVVDTTGEGFTGGGSRRRAPTEKDTDPPGDLTARERAHYADRVGPGKLYPDWKAVRAELQHKRAPMPRERVA